MPRIPEKERLLRERVLAKSIAQMKAGTFEWGDNKSHIDKDGQFEVNWYEAIRRAGWNTENTKVCQRLQHSESVAKMIALEETRMKNTAIVHMNDVKGQIGRLRDAAANELLARFENDPGQFSPRDLVTIFASMESIERRDKLNAGDLPSLPGTQINIANLNMGLVNKLPEGEFKAMLQQSADEKRKQAELMESMLKAQEAKEDIFDAEVEDDQEGNAAED